MGVGRKKNTRLQLLARLRRDLPLFRARFGVRKIALFGSHAAGRSRRSSDIDILVEFRPGAKTFDNYMNLKYFLEDRFRSTVDLVIRESLRRELRPSILAAALYA